MSLIAPLLLEWYDRCGRDLPWRRTRDPYRIWISEIILQQTRVAQGMDYYLRFVTRFPDVRSLAAASEDEVLKLWQGLGYYSRARNLWAAAQQIVDRFGDRFPADYAGVRALKGVGDYTAAAICAVAYGLPVAAVDGNVGRVLARVFDLEEPIDTASGRRCVAELAQVQLDRNRPGDYNQALMDLGALVCTPAQPRCADCPLRELCLARRAGTVALRPVKQGRPAVRDRWFNYLHFTCGGTTFLCRREGRDIWKGLYDFPLIECDQPLDFDALARTDEFRQWAGDAWQLKKTTPMPAHRLTHQRLHAVFYHLELPVPTPWLAQCLTVDEGCLGDYALPRLLDRYLSR